MGCAAGDSPRSDWGCYGLLFLLCFALYLPGLFVIPPVDRDEARFAQATKQMLETGDFVRPYFQADERFKKPIGIYWLQAAAVLITRQRDRAIIWPYRLPAMLGALSAVLLTYHMGRRLFGRRAALLGAALLASSPLLVVEAHLATTDAALLACVVAAQACLAALYSAARRGEAGSAVHAAGFWIAQGFGILIKGPIAPLVSALTVATLAFADRGGAAIRTRWIATLRCAWGVPLMVAIVLPWALAVGLATDWTFYRAWILGDLLPKVVSGHESHGGPPGLYLLLLPVTFWAAAFGAVLGVIRGYAHRARCGERFCLAWLIPTWLFFEVMPTKLPHYVLPTYPALALLMAQALLTTSTRVAPVLYAWALRVGSLLWSMIMLAVAAAILAMPVLCGGRVEIAGVIPAVAAVVMVAFGLPLCWKGRPAAASWIALAGSVAIFFPLLQWLLPDMQPLWLSRGAATAVAEQARSARNPRPLAAVGYQEPSLVFLVGTHVALLDPIGAAAFLKERSDGLVLVNDDASAAFIHAARDLGLQPRQLWSMEGLHYSKGRWMRLELWDEPRAASSE